MNIPILYEDDDFLVINKPAGLIVNNADTVKDAPTVQKLLAEKVKTVKKVSSDEESEFNNRGGIVHRLDKETSGALIVAKTEESFKNLQKQFKDGLVQKTYIALAHGKIVPTTGEINVPIGRLPWNRVRFGVLPDGRASQTYYRVLEYKTLSDGKRSEDLSLVELYPKTGRTHQIRVHLQFLRFPIFADELYAGRKTMKRDRKLLFRHFLHAKELSFLHPVSGQRITFEAPLPEELQNLLDKLS